MWVFPGFYYITFTSFLPNWDLSSQVTGDERFLVSMISFTFSWTACTAVSKKHHSKNINGIIREWHVSSPFFLIFFSQWYYKISWEITILYIFCSFRKLVNTRNYNFNVHLQSLFWCHLCYFGYLKFIIIF